MKPYVLMLLIGAISALSDLLGRGRQSAAVVVGAGARRGRRSDRQEAH